MANKEEESDLIDKLVSEWKEERSELNTDGMLVIGRILQLGKLLERRMDSMLKGFELRYSELDVLATIRRSGKPYELTPTELMRSVLITSGALTSLLNRLENRGLIYRETDAHDSRIKRAGLTKRGKKVIDRAIKLRFEDALMNLEQLSTKERDQLANLLKTLTSTISNEIGPK